MAMSSRRSPWGSGRLAKKWCMSPAADNPGRGLCLTQFHAQSRTPEPGCGQTPIRKWNGPVDSNKPPARRDSGIRPKR